MYHCMSLAPWHHARSRLRSLQAAPGRSRRPRSTNRAPHSQRLSLDFEYLCALRHCQPSTCFERPENSASKLCSGDSERANPGRQLYVKYNRPDFNWNFHMGMELVVITDSVQQDGGRILQGAGGEDGEECCGLERCGQQTNQELSEIDLRFELPLLLSCAIRPYLYH